MKIKILAPAAIAILIVACKGTTGDTTANTKTPEFNKISVQATSPDKIPPGSISTCKQGESLVFEGETFLSYTEDRMRGQGVVSFIMNVKERLTILNEDNSNFGEVVLNEDMSYFTLTMPKKIVARRLITNSDFAAYDFDAENVNANKEYLFIYVNKVKKKVKKSDLKFTFSTWENYIKEHAIKLKDCNLLTDAQGKINTKSQGLAFCVTEIKGYEIKIKSTKDCFADNTPFQELRGKVKWKSGNVLMINFALCN